MATNCATSPDAHWKDSCEGATETSEPPLSNEDEAPPEYSAEDGPQPAPLPAASVPSPAERLGGQLRAWGAHVDDAGLPPPSYEEIAQLRINVVPVYAPSSVDTPPPYTISGGFILDAGLDAPPSLDTQHQENGTSLARTGCFCCVLISHILLVTCLIVWLVCKSLTAF